MSTSPAKENMLRRIRQALRTPVPVPFQHTDNGSSNVFKSDQNDTAIIFAEQFSKLQGKFAFCADVNALTAQIKSLFQDKSWSKVYCKENTFYQLLDQIETTPYNQLEDCDVSITGCEFLVARTGTIVMSSAQKSGRTTSVYAPVHICIAYANQLVFDVKDALDGMHQKYSEQLPSLITFASGPSRTADIEKTLVTGVHGPKEVYCFLMEANH
jgi:L-lactate dehydrogenase complex protein LldG